MKGTDSVAQLVEQYTFNVRVLGSNPSGITAKAPLRIAERGFFVGLAWVCSVVQANEWPNPASSLRAAMRKLRVKILKIWWLYIIALIIGRRCQ